MKRVVRNIYQYKPVSGKDFTNIPSMTEPDLALSVREIQTKFSSGSLPHVGFIGQTDDERITFDDYQRWMSMDYELDDVTNDMLRLIEIQNDVNKVIDAKTEKRKKIALAEKDELDYLRGLKKMYEEKMQVNTEE
jgi:hypothetical protein